MKIISAQRRLRELAELGVDVSKYRGVKVFKSGKTREIWNITQEDLSEISKLRAEARPTARKKAGKKPLEKVKREKKDVSLDTAKRYLKAMKDRGDDVSFYEGFQVSKWGVIYGFKWNITKEDIPTIQRLKAESDRRQKAREQGETDVDYGDDVDYSIDDEIAPTDEATRVYHDVLDIISAIDVGTIPRTEEHLKQMDYDVQQVRDYWTERVKQMFKTDPSGYAERWSNNLEQIHAVIMKGVEMIDSDHNFILEVVSNRLSKLIGL